MNHWRHRLLQALAALTLLAIVAGITSLILLRSGWFREMVRVRIINEIEKASGARVELANFSFDARHLTANIAPLVLHGKETADEAPLAHIQALTVGLSVLSALDRNINLASLRLDRPSVHLVIYPDGSTNLPSPRGVTSGSPWTQQLLDLKVGHYEISNGSFEIDSRITPLTFSGDNLQLSMNYEPKMPRYSGQLSSTQFQLATDQWPTVAVAITSTFFIESKQIVFPRLDVKLGQSQAHLTGTLNNMRAPTGRFAVKAQTVTGDVTPFLRFPVSGPSLSSIGSETFDGILTISTAKSFSYSLNGLIDAKDLELVQGTVRLQNIKAQGNLQAKTRLVSINDITATMGDSTVAGSVEFADRKVHVEGTLQNVDVRNSVALFAGKTVIWNGTASGSFVSDSTLGSADAKLRANVIISPVTIPGGIPVDGRLDVRWDQQATTLVFGESRVSTPSSTLMLAGTLGQTLEVRATSRNLDDILPVLTLARRPMDVLPVKLEGGELSLEGTIGGTLDQPQFRGQVLTSKASVANHTFDQFAATISADESLIIAKSFVITRGLAQLSGDAEFTAQSAGKLAQGRIETRFVAKGVHLQELATEFDLRLPFDGTAQADVHVSGTMEAPTVELALDANSVAGFGEQADRVRANLAYSGSVISITNGDATMPSGRVLFDGNYQRQGQDWNIGTIRGSVTTQGLDTLRVHMASDQIPNLDAQLSGHVRFEAHIAGNQPLTMLSLNGQAAAKNVKYMNEELGDIAVTAETAAAQLKLHATGKLKDSNLEAHGNWALTGDLPGTASFQTTRMSVTQLHDLIMLGAANKPAPPPFDGSFDSSGTVIIALRKPAAFQADVTIASIQLNAKPAQNLRLGVRAQDLEIRNSAPITLTLNSKEVRVRTANFVARDTRLDLAGAVPFSSTGGADLTVKGNVNLAILQLLNPDLLARGTATLNASVRGSLQNPLLNGRMELSGASLYLNDVPNGIDAASGVILFDRSRATIERLSAETGGGQLAIRGYLEFGQALVYRLQGEAKQVRVRYPADVSMTANAQLSLSGTSAASTLAGTLTLNRAAISQGADLGRLLASASAPTTAVSNTNEYLSGMRLDLRVESAPTFEVDTSLTRNVETDVDLRMRGTLLNPTLQGTITVESGEVQVFGNRYTVGRGDIRFLNPLKIEPVLDLNLETRTRGILVSVTVSGSPQKLNVNYSSDPPLQSREIVELLAAGRDPNATGATIQNTSSAASFGSAGGLIGEAVSQQLSSRLQRFFGTSRVKIDPTLTGVDTIPAARLTIEQQVSRDITLTYTTNLTRTQEQIVRLQWDVNPQWSAVAVRDANGLFGIDFQYRKRFK